MTLNMNEYTYFKYTNSNELGIEKAELRHKENDNWESLYYILMKKEGTLIVGGDFGNAIYRFNTNGLSFESLNNPDLHKFASECYASPDGRGFQSFHSENVIKYVKKQLNYKELLSDADEDDGENENEGDKEKTINQIIKILNLSGISGVYDWYMWLENNKNTLSIILNTETLKSMLQKLIENEKEENCSEYYDWYECGKDISEWCKNHLQGLLEVNKRLKLNKKE